MSEATFFDSIVSNANADPTVAGLPRRAALVGLAMTVAAVQFSIAVGEILLALSLAVWVVMLVVEHRRPSAPPWMLPLLIYAGWALASAAFSPELAASLRECKQLVLLLLVPLTYEIVDEQSAIALTTIILSAAACSAVVGIGQYSILHYDSLGRRPRSTLGLYMTFSGLMMLALNVALGRVLFMTKSRLWPTLVMPALAVVLALTFTRSAWVGSCCAVALLLMMCDFRLVAALPVAAGVFFAAAPAALVHRFYSIFDVTDPTNRDRLAMVRAGWQIIKDHPLFGVGPNMIADVYPQYRDAGAVTPIVPHLHNVPLQIAAERGLPAVALWIWFVIAVVRGATALFRSAPREGPTGFLSATALATIVAMLGAGMFEHNFGDSEFQIVFLVLITLPFAVSRPRPNAGPTMLP